MCLSENPEKLKFDKIDNIGKTQLQNKGWYMNVTLTVVFPFSWTLDGQEILFVV